MESFLRDDVDLTYVTKVAVVPFENNSKEPFAAERIRGMAITQILAQGLFDVVDKSLVDSALREEAVDLNKAPMDAATMKKLGQRLSVQAFLLGAIDQAGVVQRGNNSYPELSVTLRLVDTKTGMIFWQASGNRTGESMGKRLFGFSSDDDFKIALKLLRQIFATISAEQKVKLPVPAPESEAIQHIDSQDDSAAPGLEADQAAPEEPGEADGLDASQEGIDQGPGYEEDQAVPMGLDESLQQGEELPEEPGAAVQEAPEELAPASAEQAAPLEDTSAEPTAPLPADDIVEPPAPPEQEGAPDAPSESVTPPAQEPIPVPSASPEPVAPPSQGGGAQAWPE